MQSFEREDDHYLADKLRRLCVKKGKQWKETLEILPKSSDIMRQLGTWYFERSEESCGVERKLDLIRAAALYNAAIVRQPNNDELKKKLSKLCINALYLAEAKQQDVNLVALANEVTNKVYEMRDEARESITLMESKKSTKENRGHTSQTLEIDAIKKVQEDISFRYNDIMDFVARRCQIIMGNSPCRYCVVGMESLARKEVTPYSDFEHVIVLEEGVQNQADYEEIREYFRWLSVIFHIIVINLGETIIPAVAIPSLNDFSKTTGDWFFDDFTIRGISFDGMMPQACKSPLGRTEATADKPWATELIQPLSRMVDYIDPEKDLKNGYNLGDILTKLCFVSGNKRVFEELERKVKRCLQVNRSRRSEMLRQQIGRDLEKFDVTTSLRDLIGKKQANIKHILYRSVTLFISALGKLNLIEGNSCFDVIRTLRNRGVINDDTTHRLLYASSVACYVRLKVYEIHSKQNDVVASNKDYYYATDSDMPKQLAELIGEERLIEYLVMACDLQDAIKHEDVTSKLDLYLKANLRSRFKVLRFANLCERLLREWSEVQEHLRDVSLEDEMWIRFFLAGSHRRNGKFQKGLDALKWFEGKTIADDLLIANTMVTKIKCLYNTDQYKATEALSLEARAYIEKVHLPRSDKLDLLSWCQCYLGICKCDFREQFEDAIKEFEMELEHLHKLKTSLRSSQIINCFINICFCLMEVKNYVGAEAKAKNVLVLLEENEGPIHQVARAHNVRGMCLSKLDRHNEASKSFKAELESRLKYVPLEKRLNNPDIQNVKKLIEDTEKKLRDTEDN